MAVRTFSGPTNTDVDFMSNLFGDFNYGAARTVQTRTGSGGILLRLKTASIPTGKILSATLTMHTESSTASVSTLQCHRLLSSNVWVRGTKNVATAGVGEPCKNWRQYDTVAWAGSAGCGTSGTDYDAVGSGTVDSPFNNDSFYTWTLPATWFSDWRDSVVPNNGMFLHVVANSSFMNWSTDLASITNNWPVFTLTTADGTLFWKII